MVASFVFGLYGVLFGMIIALREWQTKLPTMADFMITLTNWVQAFRDIPIRPLLELMSSSMLYGCTAVVSILRVLTDICLDHCFAADNLHEERVTASSQACPRGTTEIVKQKGERPLAQDFRNEKHERSVNEADTHFQSIRTAEPAFPMASATRFTEAPDGLFGRISPDSEVHTHARADSSLERRNDLLRLLNGSISAPGKKLRRRPQLEIALSRGEKRRSQVSSLRVLTNSKKVESTTDALLLTSSRVQVKDYGKRASVARPVADGNSSKTPHTTSEADSPAFEARGPPKPTATPATIAFLPSERLSVPSSLEESTRKSDLQKVWRRSIVHENHRMRQLGLQTRRDNNNRGNSRPEDSKAWTATTVGIEDAHREVLRRMQSRVKS